MGKIVAVIPKFGLTQFPLVIADKVDGTGTIQFMISELKQTVPIGPGKAITDENEVVHNAPVKEECEV